MGWQGSDRNATRTSTMSRFETETLTQEDNLKGLALMNPQWVELAMAYTPHRRVILDMDSSESPVHGQQEGAAYNGHFECVCYHPLFLFNQFGDCEGATLRPGNVHSADGWQELLEPVVKGYQKKGLRLLFRGDAAFAKPELYAWISQIELNSLNMRPSGMERTIKLHTEPVNGHAIRSIPPLSWRNHLLTSLKVRNPRPLPKRLPRGGLFVLNDPITLSPIPSLPEWTILAPAEAG